MRVVRVGEMHSLYYSYHRQCCKCIYAYVRRGYDIFSWLFINDKIKRMELNIGFYV